MKIVLSLLIALSSAHCFGTSLGALKTLRDRLETLKGDKAQLQVAVSLFEAMAKDAAPAQFVPSKNKAIDDALALFRQRLPLLKGDQAQLQATVAALGALAQDAAPVGSAAQKIATIEAQLRLPVYAGGSGIGADEYRTDAQPLGKMVDDFLATPGLTEADKQKLGAMLIRVVPEVKAMLEGSAKQRRWVLFHFQDARIVESVVGLKLQNKNILSASEVAGLI